MFPLSCSAWEHAWCLLLLWFCIQQHSVFFFARGYYSGQGALGLHPEYKHVVLHQSANRGSPATGALCERETCVITFPPALKGETFLKGLPLIDRLCGHASLLLKNLQFPLRKNPASSALLSVPLCHACHAILN